MPTRPQNPSSYHFAEAEQGLADLGRLGVDDAGRTVEILVALTHAVLSIAATLALPAAPDRDFGQDY